MTDFPSNNSLQTSNELVDENLLLLTVSKVLDRHDVSVVNKTTYETAIKVSGINAEPKNKVRIMNGNEELGEANTNDFGEFESPLLDLKHFDCYNVRAVGQWDPYPSSLPKKFTAATATPIINEVLSDGTPIADNDTISATEVTINGSSIPNQDAEAFDGDIPLKTELTNACGVCTFKLEDLAPGPYFITVKAPNGNVSTPPFRFTVIEEGIEPVTLDKITNAVGTVIPDNSMTTENDLFVEGEGEKGAKVEVFKKGETLGEATVDPVTGRYRHPTGLLTNDTYPFTVTAKYTGGGNAGPYTITVEAATTAPTQTRIYDVDGNVITDGGDLNANWFVARGFHTQNSVVKIKLNGDIQPQSQLTNDAGRWASFQSNLTVGSPYEISALTEDEKAESNKWTVVARAPSKS